GHGRPYARGYRPMAYVTDTNRDAPPGVACAADLARLRLRERVAEACSNLDDLCTAPEEAQRELLAAAYGPGQDVALARATAVNVAALTARATLSPVNLDRLTRQVREGAPV